MPASRSSHTHRRRTTTRARRWIWIAVVFGFALATSGPAAAQEPSNTESPEPLPADATRVGPPEGFEVINVKGRELTALESEVPTSVTQFNAEDIEALGAQNIADISKVTPNVEIRTAGATSPTFFIRGVGLADFNANAAGAVAIYQDDVAINAPAMQLGLLYDLVDVQVLRGPQGTGSGRNASAGAIKVYSRKPSGEFGAYLRSTYGNYDYLDFEGAVEAPLVEEILATRLAFRYSQRDPYGRNGCGDAPPIQSEARLPPITFPGAKPQLNGPVFCGNRKPGGSEERQRFPNPRYFPGSGQPALIQLSTVPGGLPSRVNDLGRWAARGQLLFQPPDLEMSWMLNGHGQRVNELSTLGQMIGSGPQGLFGGYESFSSDGYRDPDVTEEADQILENLIASGNLVPGSQPPCRPSTPPGRPPEAAPCMATYLVGPILASGRPLDIRPHRGDYNRVGITTLDVWGAFLRGDMTFGNVDVTTITAYDAYTRFRDQDQDFTPNIIFESLTDDSAWQFSQELKAEVQLEEEPVGLEFGAYYLMEELDFSSSSFSTSNSQASITTRSYKQDIFSFGVFGRFAWDFLDDFTLEGGVRYNWERKGIQFELIRDSPCPPLRADACAADEFRIWQAPTGELNLIYTFPDQDVQLIWKYARGWKSGHWNALETLLEAGVPVTPAEPETIDDFEMKLSGKWFDERVWLDASLFYYKYSQYQVFIIDSQPNQPPQLKIINANNAQVYGAEVTMVAQPLLGLVAEEIEGLRVEARFGWLESEFLDFTNDVYKVLRTGDFNTRPTSVTVDYSGNPLINSPQFKLSLTATWMFDLGRWGQIIPRYDGAWSSDIYFNQAEGRRTTQLDIPGVQTPKEFPECAIGQCAFWLHNLRLDYLTPNGKLKIGGWVRNIENTVYKTYGFDASEFGALTIAYVSEPRMYGLDFTVNW